jgi:integrase
VNKENDMKSVAAVKTTDQISTVSHMLEKHGGDTYRDIWQLGLNLALRISDLLNLTYDDFAGGETITVIEGKTGKTRIIKLNEKAQTIVKQRQALNPNDNYLFQSVGNRAKKLQKPLSREAVARKFAEVGNIIGVHLGTHSMRKTRGYAMWDAGVPLEVIARVLNHSSPAVTMRYIGLEQADINKTYDDFVL